MHIIEDTVTRLRSHIAKGSRIAGSYFQDHRTPFHHVEWHTADDIEFDSAGRLTVATHYFTEGGSRQNLNVFFSEHNVIALVKEDGQSEARLSLPGGDMVACRNGNLRLWDVYTTSGDLIARGQGTCDARNLLDEHAPEMIWIDKGDGKFIARGSGREWMVMRDGLKPDITGHTRPSLAWFYRLLSRPLGAQEYTEIAKGFGTSREARGAVEAYRGSAG